MGPVASNNSGLAGLLDALTPATEAPIVASEAMKKDATGGKAETADSVVTSSFDVFA